MSPSLLTPEGSPFKAGNLRAVFAVSMDIVDNCHLRDHEVNQKMIKTGVILAGIMTTMIAVHGPGAAAENSHRTQIQLLENTQSIDPIGWRELASNTDPAVRVLALRSIGRIDHPRLSQMIRAGLNDDASAVRAEAAFAVGQSTILVADILVDRLHIETIPTVKAALYEALGKQGQPHHLDWLLKRLPETASEIKASVFRAILRISRRFSLWNDTLNALISSPGFSNESLEMKQLWAELLANAPVDGCDARRAAILECLQDAEVGPRQLCAMATHCLTKGHSIRVGLLDDHAWRVQAGAITAITRAADVSGLETVLNHLAAHARVRAALYQHPLDVSNTERNVVGVAIHSLLKTPATQGMMRTLRQLASWAPGASDDLQCGLAAILDFNGSTLRNTKNCGSSANSEEMRHRWQLKAVEHLPPTKAVRHILKIMARASDTTRIHAIALLSKFPEHRKAMKAIMTAMNDGNPAVVLAAIDTADRLSLDGLENVLRPIYETHAAQKNHTVVQRILKIWGDRAIEASVDILESHLDDRQPGIRRVAAHAHRAVKKAIRNRLLRAGTSPTRAMRKRTGVPPPSVIQTKGLDDRLAKPASHSTVTITTSKGLMKVRLFRDDALNTVKHFVSLLKKGRYDNAPFHGHTIGESIRVGDPTGTGFGGFEPNRRCEVYPGRFLRGSIGLYQESRDGGGAQLIFAHRDMPAYEGRYTLMGQVLEGFEALDSLGEGDRILKVELLSSP